MVITSRTYTTLFSSPAATCNSSSALIRLPLSVVPHYEQRCELTGAIVPTRNKPLFRSNLWSSDEHERFLHGLEMFPNGPWKEVAKVVGTKSTRQTMTHAQKYRQKIERRMQGKSKDSKKPSGKLGLRSPHRFSNHYATDAGRPATMMFFDEVVIWNPIGEAARPMGSPTDVYNNQLDMGFLDHEFVALLTSLEASHLDEQRMASDCITNNPSYSVFA